jgi:soluble lytic murein transglycosylase
MRRSLLLLLLLACTFLLLLISFASKPLPLPVVTVSIRTPYADEPLLEGYDGLFSARARDDLAAERRFASTGSGYLRYRALFGLARNPQLPATERLTFLERALAFGLITPLARGDVRQAQLELAHLAEEARKPGKALQAYQEALPLKKAVAGLRRLEPRPRRLAQLFLDEREPESALAALRGLAAPPLRAPALAALGEDRFALAAYNRWLLREPQSEDALEGKVAVLISLERFGAARSLLERLPPNPGLEIALAEAREDAAAALRAYLNLAATGDEDALWHASGLLEVRGTVRASLPLYIELAQGDSDYADDAAYRAYTLATRLGLPNIAAEARDLVPVDSYFALRLEPRLDLPNGALERVALPVVTRARALRLVGDDEAALGELRVALQGAKDEATAITLAEALQELGEYGASSEAARDWLERGSRARRTYRAAYPRAYRETVEAQAGAHDLEPELVWAVMRQESHFYPRALSTSEAQGLLQVVPSTWDYLAELLGEPPADPFVPQSNIRYGAFYLGQLLGMFDGDLHESAAAYNGGPGYVGRLLDATQIRTRDDFLRFIDRDETREYVQRVMRNYAVYRALYR